MFIVEDNGVLDWDNLINDEHPLNQGLISEWVVGEDNPYWGGPKLWDVVGQNHGTLTNGPTWQGPLGRPGGFGSISAATDDYISIPSTLIITGPMTCSCWIKTTTSSADILFGFYDANSPFAGWGFGVNIITAGKMSYYSSAAGGWITGTTSVNDGAWHCVTATVTGTSGAFYLDGKPDGTGTSAEPGSYSGTKSLLSRSSGNQNNYNGYADGFTIHNRALSASEVFQFHREAIAGNPNRWNWIRRPQYVEQAGGGATPLTRYYYEHLLAGAI